MVRCGSIALIVMTTLGGPVLAQTEGATLPPVPPSVAIAPATAPCCTLPAMTVVDIEITEALSSKTSQIGQMFGIKLAEPVMLDGKILVPAGATGQGEVIHAAKARAAGKPGELIIAARYLDHGGTRLPLRSFKYGPTTGLNNVDKAAVVGMVIASPLMLFISGGQVDVPAGMRANAKTSSDVLISVSASPDAPQSILATTATTGEK
jgi:hypothetical protein